MHTNLGASMGKKAGLRLLAVAGMLVMASACGGGSSDPMPTARDSGVEGVPIPTEAVAREGTAGAFDVPGMTYSELLAWYQREMPTGAAFGEWAWCEVVEGQSFTQRNYTQGPTALLAVNVLDLSEGRDNGTPPAVLIARDDSGPC